MTTIEKIRAEIERRFIEYNKDSNHHLQAAEDAELLSFLDTLEESEKPMNQDELEKEMNRYFNAWQNVQCEEDCSNEGGFCCVLNGELKPVSLFHCRKIARHFAKWGAEHLASIGKTSSDSSEIPKDLDEAAIEWGKIFVKDECKDACHYGFLVGAEWQKEQMIKEAVEGWVAVDSDTEGKRRVTFFSQKPVRDVLTEYKYWAATRPRYESIKLDSNAFPNLKWEDEPKKVRIIVLPKED